MNAKLSPINELNGIIPSLHTPFKNNKSIDLSFNFSNKIFTELFDNALACIM